METLEFSTNWNKKLDCDCFTTIRLQNPKKFFRGAEFKILLHSGSKQVIKGVADVIDVRNVFINGFDDFTCMLDTGYSAKETVELIKEMYKNKSLNWDRQMLSVVLLKKQKIEPKTLFS